MKIKPIIVKQSDLRFDHYYDKKNKLILTIASVGINGLYYIAVAKPNSQEQGSKLEGRNLAQARLQDFCKQRFKNVVFENVVTSRFHKSVPWETMLQQNKVFAMTQFVVNTVFRDNDFVSKKIHRFATE